MYCVKLFLLLTIQSSSQLQQDRWSVVSSPIVLCCSLCGMYSNFLGFLLFSSFTQEILTYSRPSQKSWKQWVHTLIWIVPHKVQYQMHGFTFYYKVFVLVGGCNLKLVMCNNHHLKSVASINDSIKWEVKCWNTYNTMIFVLYQNITRKNITAIWK